jgi:N-acetylneuraminate lyase
MYSSHAKDIKRMPFHLNGLIAAAFTPLMENGSLHLGRIPSIVDHLERDGVAGIYVLGSTGEGISLSTKERREVAEAYIQAAQGRLTTVVQVGHNSLAEAKQLAAHAQQIGADAISAMPPYYFKPESTAQAIACLGEIASGAPELPLYYYHIPAKTGVELDIEELFRTGPPKLPTLAGIKYSDPNLHVLQRGDAFQNGAFDWLLGVDEMLLSGLAMGIDGAVGSTYNFAAPLYVRIIEAFDQGDLDQARRYQALAVKMIDIIIRHCGRPGLKAMMNVIGEDCGPYRLPHGTAQTEDVVRMEKELDDLGFFEWGRSQKPAHR